MRLDFDGDGLQTAVVAVASALPAAVAHPCRWANVRILALILLLLVGGCDEGPPMFGAPGLPIHFVLPDHFTGPFFLIKDEESGIIIRPTGDEYRIQIPATGELKMHDFGIFDSWHQETASFMSGARIPTPTEPGGTGELASNVFGLRGGGIGSRNGGPLTKTYFIGTKKDFDDWAKAN